MATLERHDEIEPKAFHLCGFKITREHFSRAQGNVAESVRDRK